MNHLLIRLHLQSSQFFPPSPRLKVLFPDGFEEYHGYDIRRFRDSFRKIKILKNRFGPPNKYYHYLFDGATNRFKELPKASEAQLMGVFHNTADRLLGRVTAPRSQEKKNFGQ